MDNKYTIQDVFKAFGLKYTNIYKLSSSQWKVYNAIMNCGTKELGYHVCICEECGEEYIGVNHRSSGLLTTGQKSLPLMGSVRVFPM